MIYIFLSAFPNFSAPPITILPVAPDSTGQQQQETLSGSGLSADGRAESAPSDNSDSSDRGNAIPGAAWLPQSVIQGQSSNSDKDRQKRPETNQAGRGSSNSGRISDGGADSPLDAVRGGGISSNIGRISAGGAGDRVPKRDSPSGLDKRLLDTEDQLEEDSEDVAVVRVTEDAPPSRGFIDSILFRNRDMTATIVFNITRFIIKYIQKFATIVSTFKVLIESQYPCFKHYFKKH